MYISFAELLALGMFIIALITLVIYVLDYIKKM